MDIELSCLPALSRVGPDTYARLRFAAAIGNEFDAAKLRGIADAARSRFEGLPGLRSKVFTLNADTREAVNVYVWDSEAAAKAFFNEELTRRVTELYGVRPTIAFAQVAGLVVNAAA